MPETASRTVLKFKEECDSDFRVKARYRKLAIVGRLDSRTKATSKEFRRVSFTWVGIFRKEEIVNALFCSFVTQTLGIVPLLPVV